MHSSAQQQQAWAAALLGLLGVLAALPRAMGQCACPQYPGPATCDDRTSLDTEGLLSQACSDLRGQADLCTLGGVPVSKRISIPGPGSPGEC